MAKIFFHPPSTRTPHATDQNSAFLGLLRMPEDLDGRSIAEALPSTSTAVATKF